jgi:hypothetical protein
VWPGRFGVLSYEQSDWLSSNQWYSNQSASRFRLLSFLLLAPNFSPDLVTLTSFLGDVPGPRQPPFSVGIALSAQLCLPVAFRLAAFASWSFLFPLKDSAFLTVGLLMGSDSHQTSLGFPRSAWMRCNWGGCLLYCGKVVSSSKVKSAFDHLSSIHHRQSRSDDLPITQPHQRFSCFHPPSLPLARLPPSLPLARLPPSLPLARLPLSARRFLRRYPSLSTSSLPTTQRGIGDNSGY